MQRQRLRATSFSRFKFETLSLYLVTDVFWTSLFLMPTGAMCAG